MSRSKYRVLFGSAIISAFLALGLCVLSGYNLYLEFILTQQLTELNQFQNEIQTGTASQQLAQNIAQDIAALASDKPEAQKLLAHYGIIVNKNPSPSNP